MAAAERPDPLGALAFETSSRMSVLAVYSCRPAVGSTKGPGLNSMAHTSLYRKYRPQTFDDVVGQSHITTTLRNAVAENSVAHAYLFTGSRGTGKTTTARILAKALLCERGPTPDPDASCEQCIEIAEGRHPDVHELDAASRTGVDNVREEIIGRVQYAPTRGRYKVYIIDEVHMLSTAAFNALLKTLEEPPDHVVFVLCTTHPHKVPETIHSRCQRFDFRRIGVEDIVDRLRFIGESEGIRVDKGAYALIARHAAGGMRDAITSLEQLAAFTGDDITIDDVEGLLGEVDEAQMFAVAGLVARRDVAGCFRWVATLVESGTDLAELVRGLTAHVRDLYLVCVAGDGEGFVDRTAEQRARLRAQADEFGSGDRLARMLEVLGELSAEMRWSSDPRLSFEVALTRLARPQGDLTLAALAERIAALEAGGTTPMATPSQSFTAPAAAVAESPDSEASTPSEPASGSSAVDDAAPPAPSGSGVTRAWPAVVSEIRRSKPARAQMFANVEIELDDDGKTLVIEFPAGDQFAVELANEPEMRELVRASLTTVLGEAPPFRYQLGRGAVRPVAAGSDSEGAPVAEAPEPVRDERSAPAADDVTPTEAAAASSAEEPEAIGDLEDLLVNQLGAEIVAEHQHTPGEEDV